MNQSDEPFFPEQVDAQLDALTQAQDPSLSSSSRLVADLHAIYQEEEEIVELVWRRLATSEASRREAGAQRGLFSLPGEPRKGQASMRSPFAEKPQPRHRFRWLEILAAVLLVGVLVGSMAFLLQNRRPFQAHEGALTPTVLPLASPTPTEPAPQSSPQPLAPAPCRTQHLLLAFDKSGVALGNAAAQFVLVNQSQESCTLSGYPTLQLLDARHQPIRAQVVPSTVAYLYSTHAPQRFVLQAGRKAYFVVEWGNLGDCAPPPAFLRVGLPGNQTPLLIAFRFCPYKDGVEISPLEPDQVLFVFV